MTARRAPSDPLAHLRWERAGDRFAARSSTPALRMIASKGQGQPRPATRGGGGASADIERKIAKLRKRRSRGAPESVNR